MEDSSSSHQRKALFADYSAYLVYAALIAIQFMYGGYHIVSKIALTNKTSPYVLSLTRDLLATPLFFIAGAIFEGPRKLFQVERNDIPRLFALGMTGIFGNQTLFLLGLSFTSPTNAAIMQPLIPVIATIISILFGLEKLRLPSKSGFAKIFGIALAVGGAIFMLDPKELISSMKSTGTDVLLIGNLCLIGNCASFAIYIILMRPLLKKYSPIIVTAWSYFFGLVLMIFPAIPSYSHPDQWSLPSSAWIAIGYASLLSSGLAQYLISWCNSKVSGVMVTIFMAAQPLATTLLAFLILGDKITLREGIGALLLISGLLSVCWSNREEINSFPAQNDFESGKPLLLEDENLYIEEHAPPA